MKKIGIFAGAFKPPHLGHFRIAQQSCKQNDETHIYISIIERDGFDANLSRKIWNIYRKALPGAIIYVTENSPVRTAYMHVDQLSQSPSAPDTIVYLYCGEEDMKRYDRIMDYIGKLKGLYRIKTPRLYSATNLRTAITTGQLESVMDKFPGKQDGIDPAKIYRIIARAARKEPLIKHISVKQPYRTLETTQ